MISALNVHLGIDWTALFPRPRKIFHLSLNSKFSHLLCNSYFNSRGSHSNWLIHKCHVIFLMGGCSDWFWKKGEIFMENSPGPCKLSFFGHLGASVCFLHFLVKWETSMIFYRYRGAASLALSWRYWEPGSFLFSPPPPPCFPCGGWEGQYGHLLNSWNKVEKLSRNKTTIWALFSGLARRSLSS